MDRWKRFIDWCQQPSKIKIHKFNPNNELILVTSIVILVSSIIYGTQRPQVVTIPQNSFITPEDMKTLTITTDTTLTEDYFGTIVIGADNVTVDGGGHMIIGPAPDVLICDPEDSQTIYPSSYNSWGCIIGILIEGRIGVTVKNCSVTGFGIGFYLSDTNGSTLQENTANNNVFTGFVLSSSSNNILRNNTANGNREGDGTGFSLERSFGNTLQGNTVNNNSQGISFEECEGNIFFHNTIINNTVQAEGFPGYTNTWDDGYPSGGNFWSDYKGVDADGDGIGDAPYVIDEDNVDQFPLVVPVSVR
ncbi:MAG: right-handed parallel beta-helix repeat-containing protein [Candidatus Bathyarchaeota archaeon]|nr:MAG: right-handed parallel beta-helix repeat-containing protein [Candidatus Bathyarchaeota archaeon]